MAAAAAAPGLLDILQGPHLGSSLQLTTLICLVSSAQDANIACSCLFSATCAYAATRGVRLLLLLAVCAGSLFWLTLPPLFTCTRLQHLPWVIGMPCCWFSFSNW